ncbi:MAG: hypothetical protein QW524_00115 [Candidatus Woesearchaeota archaeon]
MKDLFQYTLLFALIVGIGLLGLTIYAGYVQYSKLSYQRSVQQNLQKLSGREIETFCENIVTTESFLLSSTKSINFDNPQTIEYINLTFTPANTIEEAKQFSLYPIFLLSFFLAPDSIPRTIKTRESIKLLDGFLCDEIPSEKYSLIVNNTRVVLSCDTPDNLFRRYDFDCLVWQEKGVKVGTLGEKLVCNQNLVSKSNCTNPIIISSIEEIEKYKNQCKNFCFEIPNYFYCTSAKENIYRYLIIKFFEFLSNQTIYFDFFRGTSKIFTYQKDKQLNYYELLKNELKYVNESEQKDYSNFVYALKTIESHTTLAKNINASQIRRIVVLFTNIQNISHQEYCDIFRNYGIEFIIVRFSENQSLGEYKPGCNYVNLNFYNLDNLYSFIDSLYDIKISRLVSTKQVLVSWDPRNPEFFKTNLKEVEQIKIIPKPEIKSLPLTISVDGQVSVDMTIVRKICTTVVKK